MSIRVRTLDTFGKETGVFAYTCSASDAKDVVASLKRHIIAAVLPSEKDNAAAFLLALTGSGRILREEEPVAAVLEGSDRELTLRPKKSIQLDGKSLSLEDVVQIGRGELLVQLSAEAVDKIKASREIVDDLTKSGKIVYGITTGFGALEHTTIGSDQLGELQENLIRSHAAGVGQPLSVDQTRIMMALRINVVAKGNSGVRLETVNKFISALNANCLPYIPEKGSVGASGDLAPLAHLTLGLMGEGRMWSPETGMADAQHVLTLNGLEKIDLQAKEGLAMINGTQLITGLGVQALHKAELLAKQADIIAALTFDVLRGHPAVFDTDIHETRPHKGQVEVAKRMRALLDREYFKGDPEKDPEKDTEHIQDPYSLRCIPQVHGVVNDTLGFVKSILQTEINSTLDNPVVLAKTLGTISQRSNQHPKIKSCGNFHGEYPAMVADFLAIAVHELGNISERRMEKLTNSAHSHGLPAFLVKPRSAKEDGLNSGFMIAQYTAAALVSENKVLTHPSTVDSIPTSANQEDHVSMGAFAARKALTVVEHTEQVLAIELLAACQGLDLRMPEKTTTPPLMEVYKLVRQEISYWGKDRVMATDIECATTLLRGGKIWEVVKTYIDRYVEQHH